MAEVMINPDKVVMDAERLNALANQMKGKLDEVHALVQSMKSSWQDTAQENYEQEFSKLNEAFSSFLATIPDFTAQAVSHADLMRKIGQGM